MMSAEQWSILMVAIPFVVALALIYRDLFGGAK